MKKYLKELTVLAGRPVNDCELGSVEQAASIRDAAKNFATLDVMSYDMSFEDKSADRFKRFVESLHNANPSPVYIWTPRTIECGALLLPSLNVIKFDFDFHVNEEGILVLLTNDLADRLVLDFFKLPTGEQRMRIETQGANWGGISLLKEK